MMLRSTCVLLATACSLVLAQSQPPTLFRSMEKRMVPMHSYDSRDRAVLPGDIDGDGDLDFWVVIDGQDRLYRNDGRGVFEDVTFTNMAVETGMSRSGAFVDVDGDHDLDFVQGNVGQDRLWRNVGNGVFVDVTATTMPAIFADSKLVRAGDLDGDGDQDLLVLQNYPGFSYDVTLLRNNGAGVFTAETTALPSSGFGYCDLELGDLDGDGDLDLVYLEETGPNGVRYFANGGTGAFTDVTAARLQPPIQDSYDIALFDADGDGDLDLASVIVGSTGDRFYRNNGSGVLADDTDPVFASWHHRDVLVADMNGDGSEDLVLVGDDHSVRSVQVATNNGVGDFALLPPIGAAALIAEFDIMDCGLGDLDGDGDPDFLVAGGTFNLGGRVGRNRERWFANDGTGNLEATDDEHVARGNDRVAIVDVAYDGLPDLVTFGAQPMGLLRNLGLRRFVADTAALPPLTDVGAIAAADFDGDGLPDLFVGRSGSTALGSHMLRGTITGFLDVTASSLPFAPATCESVDAADVDGDGDVDLLVGDRTGNVQLLVNAGNGVFSLAPNFAAGVVDCPIVQCIDLDGDGDLDCVFGGVNFSDVQLFENLGNLQFQLRTTLTFAVEATAVVAGDLDGDGVPELCVTSWSQPLAVAFRGTGWSYNVVPSTIFPFGASRLRMAMVDVDHDGDLDVVTLDAEGPGGEVLRNDGTGSLTVVSDVWIRSHEAAGLDVGDLDADGDMDLVVTKSDGTIFPTPSVTTIFWNQSFAMNAVDPADHGQRFRIELTCRPGSATAPSLSAVAFSPNATMAVVPGLSGLLGLDPNGLVWMGLHTIPAGSGVQSVDLVVADLPALAGLTLWGQAVILDAATAQLRLTNTTFDVVR